MSTVTKSQPGPRRWVASTQTKVTVVTLSGAAGLLIDANPNRYAIYFCGSFAGATQNVLPFQQPTAAEGFLLTSTTPNLSFTFGVDGGMVQGQWFVGNGNPGQVITIIEGLWLPFVGD